GSADAAGRDVPGRRQPLWTSRYVGERGRMGLGLVRAVLLFESTGERPDRTGRQAPQSCPGRVLAEAGEEHAGRRSGLWLPRRSRERDRVPLRQRCRLADCVTEGLAKGCRTLMIRRQDTGLF